MVLKKVLPALIAVQSNAKNPILWMIFAAICIRIILFVTSISQLPATSDEASIFLLAEEISEGLRPLLFIGQPYQFPIESYLLSPFTEWLPHNSLGIRSQAIIFECLVFVISFFLIKTFRDKKSISLSCLLLCFPSPYWLIFTFAYTPPNYSASFFLASFTLVTACKAQNTKKECSLLFALAGVFCGLMLSNHLLTFSIAFAVLVYIFFDGQGITSGSKKIMLFCLGLSLGLIPYILAVSQIVGAYSNIPPAMPLSKIFSVETCYIIYKTVGRVMGFFFPIFPDFHKAIIQSPKIVFYIIPLSYGVITLFYILQRIIFTSKTVRRGMWPKCSLGDLAVITSVVSIVMFASRYPNSDDCRYLIFIVFVMPLVVGQILYTSHPFLQKVTAIFVCCYVMYNIATYEKVLHNWRMPGEIRQLAGTEDISSLLSLLKKLDITECYASFWLAYRITYESERAILCSLPYNERFPGWPIFYKQTVDESKDAAYVLTNTSATRTPAWLFEKELQTKKIRYERTSLGPFNIYNHFFSNDSDLLSPILENQYSLYYRGITNDKYKKIERLINWDSKENQQKGQSLEIFFSSPEKFAKIEIIHNSGFRTPPDLRVTGYLTINNEDIIVPLTLKNEREYFIMKNGHPVMRENNYIKHFNASLINKLHIEIITPNPNETWKIEEMRLYRAPENV